jgi:hypothetical protein
MKDKIWSLQRPAWCPPREARIDSGGWPERVETRLTDNGGRVATPACRDQGRIHGVDEGQQCSEREAQQGEAARHSQARVS